MVECKVFDIYKVEYKIIDIYKIECKIFDIYRTRGKNTGERKHYISHRNAQDGLYSAFVVLGDRLLG